MLNKRKEKSQWPWITGAILVILLGVWMIVNSFMAARREMIREHQSHLLDIVWATDQNISNLLTRCHEELDYAMIRSNADVERYRLTGDPEAIVKNLDRIPLMESGYISRLLVMDGERTLRILPQDDGIEFSFPYGRQEDRGCLCTDAAGTQYLAIISDFPDSTVCFAALIDLQRFYSLVLSEELSGDYWLGLYNPDTDIVMQNNDRHSPAVQIDPEKTLNRNSGLSRLVLSEREGRMLTDAYIFEDTRYNFTEERQIAVIPTGLNNNGMFTVAISVESAHYFDLLRNLLWRIVGYTLASLAAVTVILTFLRRNRRTNLEIREQVELLREQNETMQALVEKTRELAHHQRLEMIGTMTSSIAHEFNNLLTPIMGYSLMTMESLPEGSEDLFDNVAEIYEASFRAKTLVSRLSSLSRKNSDVTSRSLCPDIVLEKVLDVAQPSVPRKVKLVRDFGCPEACLFGDETQLAQLALNIIINAFQAMEESGGTLTITTRQQEDTVLLRFSDTGPGIPAEVLEHIFEPFYTTKDLSRGTGLGLAIVKQTVESHRGEVRVESEPGVGTTFEVRFPVQIPEEQSE